jgi:CRISPR/Cas system-associated endoribonuclease Cas2
MVFLISYDLRKPDFDYDNLYQQLGELDAVHVQDSVWAINTGFSATKIFDLLWACMHSQRDRLLVVPFDKTKQFKAINSMQKLGSI